MKTKEELVRFITDEISYDGHVFKEYTCKKCGYHHQDFSYWLDKKDSLSHNITAFLGYKGKLKEYLDEIIYKILDETYVTSKNREDAERLAIEILEAIGE